jgi:hypothetical protein
MKTSLLRSAGACSATVAGLHVVIPFVGAPAYRYFGAGEAMARRAEAGSWEPAIMTFVMAAVFAGCSAYAFAAVGTVRRLPLLRTGLVAIGVVYTLRGLAFFPGVVLHLQKASAAPWRYVAFSFAALVIGLLYLIGTLRAWRGLEPGDRGEGS